MNYREILLSTTAGGYPAWLGEERLRGWTSLAMTREQRMAELENIRIRQLSQSTGLPPLRIVEDRAIGEDATILYLAFD